MTVNASKVTGGGKSNIPPLEPGSYPARIQSVIDLGLQAQRPYQGQDKQPAHELMLTYELSDEFLLDEDGQVQEDKPRFVSDRFPLFPLNAEKAKSTKRYLALDPTQEHGGDFGALLGMPVTVTITQSKPTANGRIYNNVAGIAPMRSKEADKLPALVNDQVLFDLDEPDMQIFKSMLDWIRGVIAENLEFKGSKLEAAMSADPAFNGAEADNATANVVPEDGDDGEAEHDEENPY